MVNNAAMFMSCKGPHVLSWSEPRFPKSSYDWAGDANYQAKLPSLQLSIWFCQTICSVALAVIALASISQVSLPRLETLLILLMSTWY